VSELIDLDDLSEIERIDASGMLAIVENMPQQFRDAIDIGTSSLDLPDSSGVDNIVFLGMGGSGIAGDIVSNFPEVQIPVPAISVKGYNLPEFARSNTLVFAISYSGNTEETIFCFEEAIKRNCRIVAITSGGKLERLANDKGVPLYKIPSGLQPRAALGYLFIPVMSALERLGICNNVIGKIEGSISMLEERSKEYGRGNPASENPAKRIAKALSGYLPVIYGSEGALMPVALRWKCQFNENSKVPAFCNYFPELNHNETVGWYCLEEVWSRSHIIVLRDKDEHPRVSKRIQITSDLISNHTGHITQVFSRGANKVERFLDLLYLGDLSSVYLALHLGVDPTPVSRIDELKKRLGS